MARHHIVSLLLAITLAPSAASADPQSDKLFEEGRKLLEAGDAQGACAKFDKAIAIDPLAPGTMLNLGLCHETLHHYATALHWFRKAQTAASEAKPRLTEHERVATEHTQSLAAKVATISITFSTGTPPADAKVRIDHDDITPDEYGRAEVDPGHHVLDVGAPGMKNVHQEFDVADQPGPATPLTVELVAGSNVIVIDRGASRRKAGIYTAIGGGTLVLGSALLGMYAANEYCGAGFFSSWYKGGGDSCPNVRDVHNGSTTAKSSSDSAISTARWGGTGMFIAGVAAIGVASYLYFSAPQAEKIDQTVWVPTVDREHVGFALSGRF